MIYCPRCGTANREGSKFCNDCGQKLGTHTRIKCPHCGIMNSVQNVFCDECGGRLLPAPLDASGAEVGPPIKGLSLPTKASAPEEDAPDEGEAPESAAPESAGDMPTWLRALGDSWSDEPDAGAAGEEGDEIPDWLQDLRASLPAEEPGEGQGAEEDVPDWLRELRSPAEKQEADLLAPIEGHNEGEDAWLEDAEQVEEEAGAQGPESGGGELPDWLEAANASGEQGEEEEDEGPVFYAEGEAEDAAPDWIDEPEEQREPPVAEGEGAAAPEWLAALGLPEGDEEEEMPFSAEEEADEDEAPAGVDDEEPEVPAYEEEAMATPEWLVALGLVGAVEDEAAASGHEEPVEEEPAEEETLDWVDEEAIEMSPEETAMAPPPDTLGMPEAELPEWLEALRPPEAEVEVLSGEELAEAGEVPDWLVLSADDMEEDEGLARADIPGWLLALKPLELREEEDLEEEAPEVEEVPEEGGLLAGLIGTLPVEMLIAQPRAVTATGGPELPSSDTPQARLFAEIVRRPPESPPKPMVQAEVPLIARLPLWIIYLVLIAVVTVPLLIGEPVLVRRAAPLPAEQSLYQGIESLEAGSPVLVAFDYDPTTSGEMDVLARSIVGHLMDRQARVVAVSLLPAGPATAEMVLDEVAQGRPGDADGPGLLYANLGYLPGQVAAVRLLGESVEQALPRDFQATPLAELEAAEGVTDVQSFALIIELAASQETLRWWVEQAGTPYNVPLSAGVSASVEPIARAYYETESRQLKGLIAGVPGAAEYEALVNGEDVLIGPTAMRLDAQLAGHLVFVLVLVVGAVVRSTRRNAGRGQ
jgi:hypothetical protein